MPMPLWWGQVNKRVFNPMALRKGKWPVIQHVGRTSGRRYRTPLEAHQAGDGFIFVLVYGSRSDWVQNVLTSQTAALEIDGATIELLEPVVLNAEQAFDRLPAGTKPPPRLLKIDEFLHMRPARGE